LKWDMATMPTFAEAPATGMMLNQRSYVISKTSAKKDAAFEAIAFLLSDEMQRAGAHLGIMPVMKVANVEKEFGKDVKALQGKHTEAIFKNKVAKPVPITNYDLIGRSAMVSKFAEIIFDGKDVNTALREAEEQINQSIPKP